MIKNYIESSFYDFKPLFTTIELTKKCQLNCKHCYNIDRLTSSLSNDDTSDLSYSQIEQVIDELAGLEAIFVNFTGGEPLLYRYITNLVRYTLSRGLIPRIKTNGLILTKIMAKKLASSGLRFMDISVYGASNQTYGLITGNYAGLDLLLAGIQNALEAQIKVTLNFTLQKNNYQDLKDIDNLSKQFGVGLQISDEITDSYDQIKKSLHCGVTQQEFAELIQGSFGDLFFYHNKDKAVQCSCARSVCAIAANGDVYPCIGAPIIAGNIKKNSLPMIWHNSSLFKWIRGLKEDDFISCQECEYIKFCSRSSGSVYVNTGNYTGCDEIMKMKAKVRKKFSSRFL